MQNAKNTLTYGTKGHENTKYEKHEISKTRNSRNINVGPLLDLLYILRATIICWLAIKLYHLSDPEALRI